MEHHHDERHAEPGKDDGGFTMDFAIEVVKDIEAQLEEMMRLGALGYFKEARQVAQSIAPEYQQKFEVVFEQLKLMLYQGAYTDLIAKARSYPQETWTPAQSALVSKIVAVAHVGMSSDEETQASDALRESQHIRPDLLCKRFQHQLADDFQNSQELLEVILSLRLWYLGQVHQPEPSVSLLPFEKVLFDGALRLLDKKQFWAGKTVFQIACFHMLREVRYGVLWPLREPFGWDMKIAFFGGAFVPRLTFMVFVQTMLEGTFLCLYNTSGRFKSNHNDSDARALRYAIGRAQETLEKEFGNEDYGPRLALRRRLFALLYLIVPDFGRHLELEGAIIMEEAKTLQANADHNEDCTMQDMLKILESVLSLKCPHSDEDLHNLCLGHRSKVVKLLALL
ncbi:hypothetical protein KC330_g8555 [Hortaea werneckii]|nr:hypothetical protein KC330_g8555 [Hortaea werneckii]